MNTDAVEAFAILTRVANNLIAATPGKSGRNIVYLRHAVSDMLTLGEGTFSTLTTSLPNCFAAALTAGATFDGIFKVHKDLLDEAPISVLAVLTVQYGMRTCLSNLARILVDTTFVSRDDIDVKIAAMNAAFDPAEVFAADNGQTAAYRAIINLHGSVIRDLSERERPLPRMIDYQFGEAMPALVLANRLYADASRSDELIAENKIVNPVFAPNIGRALSN